MSRTKRMVSLVLIMAVLASMAVTAMAANDSITIKNARKGEKYQLYKLFDLSVDNADNPNAYTYTVNSAWKSFFDGEGAEYITLVDGRVDDIKNGKTGAADLAEAAAAWSGKPAPVKTETCETTGDALEGTVVFEELENGYYLITSSLGTVAMTETAPGKSVVEIDEKNPVDTITKQVKEDSTGVYGEKNDAQVGDKVEFKSVATILKNTRNVKIYDTMEAGLTYNAGSVEIADLTKGTDYTVDENTDGYAFVITLNESYLNKLEKAETDLTLTYTATLNEKAIVITGNEGNKSTEIDDQINKIRITFGDAQFVEAETVTTTHKFSVHKHAKDSTANLAGATFSLKKGDTVVKLIKIDEKNYRVANGEETGAGETFTTVEDGDIVIWGVDSDNDYALEEISAPDGYNKLAADVPVTVNADNSTRVDVENNTGTQLPTTGGMGTKMFYIVGMMLMTGSAVMLITKKRMKAE